MPMKRRHVLLGGSLLLLLLMACTEARSFQSGPEERTAPRIQAVTLDAIRPPEANLLERLRGFGITHVTLIPFGFQPGYDVPEIRLHTASRWYSESDRGIRALARQADSLGLQIIVKPHVWVGDYDVAGQERDRVGFQTETGWAQWEAQYRAFLLHYARLAREIGAPLFVVGTELAGTVRARPAFWRALIRDVRAVYDGELTYAANWFEEYQDVSFWDALDYVGIQAYFPLSEAEDPGVDVLRQGWAAHQQAIARLAEQVERPVLFTELGYRSVAYAAAEPWRWPAREEAAAPDYALQRRLYEAFFRALWDEAWLAGVVLWKWHPAAEGDRPVGFTPQDKPAAQVIRRWFSKGASS